MHFMDFLKIIYQFYLLSYCNMEQYLEEALSKINEKYNINQIIYKEV